MKIIPILKQAISDKFSEINGEMCQIVSGIVADRFQRCIGQDMNERILNTLNSLLSITSHVVLT